MTVVAVADGWVRAGRGRSPTDAVWVTDRIFAVADGCDNACRSGTEALRQVRRLLRPMPNPRDVARTLQAVNFALWSDSGGVVASTITLAVWLGSYLIVGHIGDSRAYLVRGGEVHVLTMDHGGDKDDDQVLRLGMRQASPVSQVILRRVLAGDRLVLCTDGLWRAVTHGDILDATSCSVKTASSILKRLVPTGVEDGAAVVVAFDDEHRTDGAMATACRSREVSW